MTQITIDDKAYELESLSDEAKAQLGSLRFVEGEIQRLQGQLAICQTARIAYATALRAELQKADPLAGDTIRFPD